MLSFKVRDSDHLYFAMYYYRKRGWALLNV